MTQKAFLVEDSAVIRDSLIAALHEMAPVRVVGCADGEDTALSWLGDMRNSCDLVIVDLYLRQGSGLGVLERLHAGWPGLETVVLSNYATSDIRRRCLALGASRVFDKSSEFDELALHCMSLDMPSVPSDTGSAPAPIKPQLPPA